MAEPPRSARALQRRSQLVALASRAIYEQGYERFSVNDLAVVAGLSIGGVYRHISTKSDLLVLACEDIYGGVHEKLTAAVAEAVDAERGLRSALALYLASCEAARRQIIVLYREYRHLPAEAQRRYQDREQRIATLFADVVTAGTRAGEFRAVDAWLVAQDLVLLGHLPALKGWALRDGSSAEEQAREQVEFVVAGLTSRD